MSSLTSLTTNSDDANSEDASTCTYDSCTIPEDAAESDPLDRDQLYDLTYIQLAALPSTGAYGRMKRLPMMDKSAREFQSFRLSMYDVFWQSRWSDQGPMEVFAEFLRELDEMHDGA